MTNDTNNKEMGIFRQALRSEITWFLFLFAGLWGFVTTVVLPLQRLQYQVTSLQVEIADELISIKSVDARVLILEKQYIRLLQENGI